MFQFWKLILLITITKIILAFDEHCATLGRGNKIELFICGERPANTPIMARATFVDNLQTTGFTLLNITTQSAFSFFTDYEQAYAAGYLEATLTTPYIDAFYYNSISGLEGMHEKINSFLKKNMEYMYMKIDEKSDSTYWNQVKLFLYQFKGLHDGYYGLKNAANYKKIDPSDKLWLIQIMNDVWDIARTLGIQVKRVHGAGSCSVMIKIAGEDILCSHVTWTEYSDMLRVMKKYDFTSFKTSKVNAVAMSSYPGFLCSGDDFYITSSNLTIMETTNDYYNDNLFAYVKPRSLVFIVRVMVSTFLADSSKGWSKMFQKENMGTYNNQWMVVDYKRPINENSTGILWVLEQIPGTCVYSDQTAHLLEKPWTSYNIPFYPEIYNISGFQKEFKKYGNFFSYEDCPRAKIFHRDEGKVKDINTLIRLMRYNNYTNDPFAKANCTPLNYSAEGGISARSDLIPTNQKCFVDANGPRCHGGTDVKAVNGDLITNMRYLAISGPTHQSLPVFDWSTTEYGCKDARHYMLPERYNFSTTTIY